MVTFTALPVFYGKSAVGFNGRLIATKKSFKVCDVDAQQLEFFELKIYQSYNQSLVIQGFSPFCNEYFLEVFNPHAAINFKPLIQRIIGCISIGDDERIIQNFMVKVKEFLENILIKTPST